MTFETAFVMDACRIKYGPGVTRQVGHDMRALDARRVMVLTDPHLASSEPVSITLAALRAEGIDAVLFDRVRIEPTDVSFKAATAFATDGRFDGYVAVGGGSTIDTAKATNLYATYPSDFLAYVNKPVGWGRPVPGPLAPLIAIPTTAGTSSESSAVAAFGLSELHAKAAISHPALRPIMGIVDPNHTRTLPKMVAASGGWDVLCQAIEALTALPFHQRPAPGHPGARPPYQGANPISDVWAARAVAMISQNLVRAIDDPSDDQARQQMLLAATYGGFGFGNAGVHLPHGISYPVSGMVRDFTPQGYPQDRPIIPHGMAVALNAPAALRFTAQADPERHLYVAKLMGADVSGAAPQDAGEVLARAIVALMRRTGMPNGLGAVGYGPDDVEDLVAGTLAQHRLTRLSPRPAGAEDLRRLFLSAMSYW